MTPDTQTQPIALPPFFSLPIPGGPSPFSPSLTPLPSAVQQSLVCLSFFPSFSPSFPFYFPICARQANHPPRMLSPLRPTAVPLTIPRHLLSTSSPHGPSFRPGRGGLPLGVPFSDSLSLSLWSALLSPFFEVHLKYRQLCLVSQQIVY